MLVSSSPYITSWMIPCALFIFAFCSGGDQHPIGDLIAEVLFGCEHPFNLFLPVPASTLYVLTGLFARAHNEGGVICAFMSFITFLLNMYEHRSASAVGAGTFLRSLLAAAFPLFITCVIPRPAVSLVFATVADLRPRARLLHSDCVDKLGVEGTVRAALPG